MALATRALDDPKRKKAVDVDFNPLYASAVVYTGEPGKSVGVIKSWMAFDPKYGPDSQEQIDWHIANSTPGAEQWEVGKPCHNFR